MKEILFNLFLLAFYVPEVILTRIIRNTETPINLCSVENFCSCANKQIVCHFREDVILNNKYFMPKIANSLIINLVSSSSLRLEQGFFMGNKINRILINGTMNGEENIEIGNFAFRENHGPYPEIEISSAHTIVLREQAFFAEFTLNIFNCREVIILKNAFMKTQFKAKFQKISDLRILSKAFSGTQNSQIEIYSSNIISLSEIDSSLRSIFIFNCSMDKITSHTFNVNHIDSLVIKFSKIGTIETKAITEKLYCKLFEISNCDIHEIETSAICGSGMSEFLLNNNRIESINSNGIDFTGIDISLSHNTIKNLGPNWFRVKQWSNINIYNNTFGKYNNINIERSADYSECRFEKNYITDAAVSSLNFPFNNCLLKNIYFYKLCSCNLAWIKTVGDKLMLGDINCRLNEPLIHCLNSTTSNLLSYVNLICNPSVVQLDCLENQEEKPMEREFLSIDNIDQHLYLLFWSFIIIALIVISVIITLAICFNNTSCHKKAHQSHHAGMIIISDDNSKRFLDGDRLVIVESLEQIRRKQPDVYQSIAQNTQKLLIQNLSETEKVLTIGEIVRVMDDCEFAGENFVAFTDVLYKHLAPQNNDRTYSLPLIINEPLFESADHIYAEPNNIEPFLSDVYNVPIDRSEFEIYSEPLQNIVNETIQTKNIL